VPPFACCPERSTKIDELLDTLSDTYRREVIDYFENHAETSAATLSELVDHLDARVAGTNPAELRRSLHHRHLPKLEDRGWLEYDARNHDVHYRGRDATAEHLTLLADVFE
jgi:hypothetical protein